MKSITTRWKEIQKIDCFQIIFAVASSIATAVVHTRTLTRELPRPKNMQVMEKRASEIERPAQTSNRFVS
jgi:hypothetical protein